MTDVWYALIALVATTVGAVAGLGGGVIIKPLLDALGRDDAPTIGVYAAGTVLAMCLVSIARQLRVGFRFDRTVLVAVSAGSVAGGLAGERMLHAAAAVLDNATLTALQAGLLALTLVAILGVTLRPAALRRHRLTGFGPCALVGAVLGLVSVFLGIGGGPLNIALLTWLFSFSIKEATVYSLATILWAQVAKLGLIAGTTGFARFDLHQLPAMVGAAVLGGLAGTAVNQRASEGTVRRIYLALLIGLIGLSGYNLAVNLLG